MLNRDFREIISAFNAAGVEYLVVGAYAVAAHGIARATGDIDFWIRPEAANAERVWNALVQFGAPLDRISTSDFAHSDTIVQFGVVPNRVDVITSIEAVSFDEAWAAKMAVDLDGLPLHVISRAHLIRNGQAAGSRRCPTAAAVARPLRCA